MDPQNHVFLFLFEKLELYPGCLPIQFTDAILQLPDRFHDGMIIINPGTLIELTDFVGFASLNAIKWAEINVKKCLISTQLIN